MILMAATAIGFSLMRLCWPRWSGFSPHAVREWANATAGVAMLPFTVAFLVIRRIRPRPRIERLMCQPGMAACCAGTVIIAAGLCAHFLSALIAQVNRPGHARKITWFLESFWYVYGLPIGPAVAATWFALILSGRWRPERGWIDRLGSSIGGFWIVFVLVQWEFGRWTSAVAQFLTPWLRHR
jgi:hypothetical protein